MIILPVSVEWFSSRRDIRCVCLLPISEINSQNLFKIIFLSLVIVPDISPRVLFLPINVFNIPQVFSELAGIIIVFACLFSSVEYKYFGT